MDFDMLEDLLQNEQTPPTDIKVVGVGGAGGVGGVGTAKHVAQSANTGRLDTLIFVSVNTVVPFSQQIELYLNTVGHAE